MEEKTLNFRIAAELHAKLKLLSLKEGKTIKDCVLESLDKAFPGWRDLEIKK